MRNKHRYITQIAIAAVMMITVVSAHAAGDHFSHVTVTPPTGWVRAEAGGWLQFTPPDVPQGQTVAIQVSPGGPSSRDLAEEFADLVKVSANGMTIVQQNPTKSSTDHQGLKTISQGVVFQDANGKKLLRYFVSRRSGGRFESVVYTASTPDLANQYAPVMNAFIGGMVFDGAPAPHSMTPAGVPAQTITQKPYPGAARTPTPVTQQPVPAQAIRLSPIGAKPMWITGRAVFENGQPIPKFKVTMAGMSGKFDPLFNNHLSGPQARETATSHGGTDGVNGSYAIHATEDATVTGVYAMVHLKFDNMDWGLPAWPTDNIADGSGTATNDDFRGHTSKGIVRDFVLKMSGLKPGYDPAKSPDHHRNADPFTINGYYGGTVVFACGNDSTPAAYKGGVTGMMADRGGITKVYPAGSIVTVTLTPTGSRVDGLPSHTITRSCPVDINFSLFGIPYAIYTATATLTAPGGAVHKLQVSAKLPLSLDNWNSSAPVKWQPMPNVDAVIIPITIWLAE